MKQNAAAGQKIPAFADHGTTVNRIQQDYARARIEEARRQTPSRMPAWLKRERHAYVGRLLAVAEKCHAETGHWFLARGEGRGTDEMETKAVWVDLLPFVKLEELPGYSEENHRQAIGFWQSWQNRSTGRLYNPLYQDPQNPGVRRDTPGNRADYSPEQINMKYVPAILTALGAALPLPVPAITAQVRADAGEDVFDHLWESVALRNPSHAGAFPLEPAMALDAGDESKIPQVEAGMAALLRAYNRETGLWRPEPLAGFPWRDYQPSAGFKIISRLCGYAGLENFPEALLKTAVDNMLAHRGELHDQAAMARNYAETFAHFLMLGDYRREEQLDAMEECLEGFRDPLWWKSTANTGYCLFGSGLIGAFLNWEDLPIESGVGEWQRFVHGCTLKWRFVADPWGNWVNVLPKQAEEMAGHPDHDAAIHGLKARNRSHWARRVVDVVPDLVAPGLVPLERETDAAGAKARFSLHLNRRQLDELVAPHLKSRWVGAWDVSLNGVPVKKVRYNLPDVPAGWWIPPDAAHTLRAGENVVEARLVGRGQWPTPGAPESKSPPFIHIGLVDWR